MQKTILFDGLIYSDLHQYPLWMAFWHIKQYKHICSSNFSGVQTEVAIKGVRLSVSGSGYADVIINNPNRKYKSDVYEIKPISAYYNYAYGFLAQVQLNEYVLAINNDNRNEHLQRARTGKKILSDLTELFCRSQEIQRDILKLQQIHFWIPE